MKDRGHKRQGWKLFADDLPDREQSRPKAPPDARNLEPMFIRTTVAITILALIAFYFFVLPLLRRGY